MLPIPQSNNKRFCSMGAVPNLKNNSMKRIELIISHGSLRDNDIATFALGVLHCLTGNTLFNIATERLDKLRTQVSDYQIKLAKSKDGSKLDTIHKNGSKAILVSTLDELALDLCVEANGDRTKLASTGFMLTKEHEKSKPLEKPTNFKVDYGNNTGELIFSVGACKEARFYVFYYIPVSVAQTDPTAWRSVASTTRKLTINGFIHGQEYDCRCSYQGSDQKHAFSNTLRILAR